MGALQGGRDGARGLRLPALASVSISSAADEAFGGVDVALLVGARPAGQGHGTPGPPRGQRVYFQRPGPGSGGQRDREVGCW